MNTAIKYSQLYKLTILSIFPITMLHMFLRFVGYNFVPLGLFPRVGLFFCALASLKYCNKSIEYTALVIYILINLLSGVLINSSVMLEGYSYDLLNFILPMGAFFIGANNKYLLDDFYKVFLYSVLFCCGVGLILFFFSTGWYIQRISELNADRIGTELQTVEDVQKYTRFSSFMFDSYAIQYLGVPALSVLLFYMYKVKDADKMDYLMSIFFVFILVLSIILCQQRSSWGYLGVLLFFYLIASFKSKSMLLRNILLSAFLIGVAASIYLLAGTELGDALLKRSNLFSVSGAMSGRTDQYAALWNNWENLILGHGMGSGGAIARIAGLPGASDAGYMKILYENGVLGMTLFLCIVIPAVIKMLKYWKIYLIELHIVVFFLIAMTGSNSLCISIYYGIMFWYAIGRACNHHGLNNQLKKYDTNNRILSSPVSSYTGE